MTDQRHYSSDIAFTRTVKDLQARNGSRRSYARMEENGGWQAEITPALADFIGQQTSVFLATVNGDGQPYIQHRGGPAGFLRVLDATTIAFADFAGNRQFISQGNLLDNPKAHLFLIDYAHRRRIKIWGEARFVEGNDELLHRLMPEGYPARPERVLLFTVKAWDSNCNQHIPQRFEASAVEAAITERDQRIAALEARLAQVEMQSPQAPVP